MCLYRLVGAWVSLNWRGCIKADMKQGLPQAKSLYSCCTCWEKLDRDLSKPETGFLCHVKAESQDSLELSKLFTQVTELSLLQLEMDLRWLLQKDFSVSWLPLLCLSEADDSYKADLVMHSWGDPGSVSEDLFLFSSLLLCSCVAAYWHFLPPALGDIKARSRIQNEAKQLSPTTYDSNSKSRPLASSGVVISLLDLLFWKSSRLMESTVVRDISTFHVSLLFPWRYKLCFFLKGYSKKFAMTLNIC